MQPHDVVRAAALERRVERNVREMADVGVVEAGVLAADVPRRALAAAAVGAGGAAGLARFMGHVPTPPKAVL